MEIDTVAAFSSRSLQFAQTPLLSKDAAQSGWLVFNTLRTCGQHPEARSLEHLLTNWFNQTLHCHYITSHLVQFGCWKNKVR